MNILLLAALCYGALVDIQTQRIPNALVLALLGLALLQQLPGVPLTGPSPASALAGLGLGLALSLPCYAMGLLGAGDAKLLAACGAVLGWPGFIWLQLASWLFIGVLSLLWLLSHGLLQRLCWHWRHPAGVVAEFKAQTVRLPFGGALFLAALAQQFYG
ncbi:prepilin peptidase [Pseudaeromonas paramecii]|uniref:Prepilin type IV endopeptidase peptidase domain-containing protein n=1 Tax=Pseudaeromonas paramecii TaxID=2138166 RepID=A0ABP8QAV9_9GAMM